MVTSKKSWKDRPAAKELFARLCNIILIDTVAYYVKRWNLICEAVALCVVARRLVLVLLELEMKNEEGFITSRFQRKHC